jgi:hypothetical protein
MEAVPTAASQIQAGATQGLLRASPADEAATVIVPGGRCLCVTKPLSIPCIVGGSSKQGPDRKGLKVPWPEVSLVLLAVKQGNSSGGWLWPLFPEPTSVFLCPPHESSQ